MKILFLVLLGMAMGWLPAGASSSGRPNILWVVSEDNAPRLVGAYGDPLARTPHIDRLAEQGIVYDRAYAASPVCAPSRSSIITGRYASGLGTQHMRSDRPLPDAVKFFPEFLRKAGYFTTNNDKTDYNTRTAWDAAWDENNGQAHWRHRASGQPFFSVFNFMQSHESGLHSHVSLKTDPARVEIPPYLPDTPTVREDLARNYDIVSRADAEIGKVLAALKADGLEEDTIVFYYADHGGATPRSKRFLYEIGTHVPLILHFPRKFQHLAPVAPGTHIDELVNLIDLAPTVLSIAGIDLPAQFAGRALAGPARTPAPELTFMFRDRQDERYDLSRAVTDGHYRYIRNYHPEEPLGQHVSYLWRARAMQEWDRLFREGKLSPLQRRFFEPKAPEELYDVRSDPYNMRNLADDPAFAAEVRRMRSALRGHQLAVRDTGFMPEPLMVRWAAEKSPVYVARDDRRYPLGQILDLLDGAQVAVPSGMTTSAAANSSNALLRYWAAVLSMSAKEGLPVGKRLLNDSESVVRITAAEAILRERPDPAAWEVLAAALRDPLLEMRLFTLNTAERVPGKFSAVMKPVLEEIAESRTSQGTLMQSGRLAQRLLETRF